LELYLDGQRREALKGEPFGKTLEALNREAAASGRAILAVFLDGRELSVEEEQALLDRPADGLGRVELRTTPAREWGLDGLGEVPGALAQIGDRFRACAEAFRQGRLAEGLDQSNAAISAFLRVIQGLTTAASMARAKVPAGLKESIESVVGAVRALEAAARAGDGVAAADVVEYQLPEALEALAGLVRTMAAPPRTDQAG